jgi:ubiquinone/menaquinone biosynthesis C-methylase UbiE
MPSITENLETWGKTYAWPQDGDEWSDSWGSSEAQWSGCLYPRIFPFLGGRILEIAPGHGRWTQFLQDRCTSLIGIDLAESCVDQCKERFRGNPNLEFYVNDGMTFPMVENGSIDFVFTFGSLVHAEADVMASYTREIARVLKPRGVAFIHHSNLEAVRNRSLVYRVGRAAKRTLSRLPGRMGESVKNRTYPTAWRARTMSAAKMRAYVSEAGMWCAQQELMAVINDSWWLTDCMSTIVNAPGGPCAILENRRFIMEEAAAIKRISSIHASE